MERDAGGEAGKRGEEMLALLRVGFPVIFTNFTLAVMQITDAWMIGSLGSEALAAVTPPGLLLFALVSFGYFFLSSVTTFISQSLGKGNPRDCGFFAWQGIFLAAALGVALIFLRPAGAPLFALIPNESERVLGLEISYFQIGLFSLGPALVSIAISNYFIGIQRNRVVILSSFLGMCANVFFNYGLIFGNLGFPEWGFEGAAWGTVFATLIEVAVLLMLFLSGRHASKFGTRRAAFSARDQERIARIGLPAGLQGAIDVISWGLVLSWLVAYFGTAHQAATTVLLRCMNLCFLPAEGVAVAALTMVGSAVGSGNHALAESRARLAFGMTAGYMMVVGFVLFVFRRPVLGFFSDDPAVVAVGAGAMIFVALFQIFDAMNISYLHALQGVGDNLWPAIVNVVLCGVILVGGGLAMVHWLPQLESRGIWALAGFYMLGQGLAFRGRWRSGAWKKIDLFRAQH